MEHFQVGFKSRAGFPVMYDKQYGTIEEAREVMDRMGPNHYIWRVTAEEVK